MVHLAILASGELERYRASDSSEEMICHCFTYNMGGLEVARNQSKVIEFTILKVSKSPISGYKCYSVFRNGELYFTIDGERVSGV